MANLKQNSNCELRAVEYRKIEEKGHSHREEGKKKDREKKWRNKVSVENTYF